MVAVLTGKLKLNAWSVSPEAENGFAIATAETAGRRGTVYD